MLPRNLLSILILMPCLVYLVTCAPGCNRSDLKECIDDLRIVLKVKDLSYGETEDALDLTCQILEGALRCTNEYSRRCMTGYELSSYQHIMTGPQSMIDELCTKGSEFRNEYLRNAGCFMNTTEDFTSCYDSFERKTESMRNASLTMRNRMSNACCIFNDYKLCTRQFLEEKCNIEAADFADRMVNKAGGSLVQTQCAPYSFNPGDC